jgi:hypothetical protein
MWLELSLGSVGFIDPHITEDGSDAFRVSDIHLLAD